MTSTLENPTAPKKEQGKNLILLLLVLLLLISGIKLYTDRVQERQKNEKIDVLTSENEELRSSLDSVESQLLLRIQELEKLGANVSELQALHLQLLQEKKKGNQRTAEEITALRGKIERLNSMLTQKDGEILQLKENFGTLSTENESLKIKQALAEERVGQLTLEREELVEKVAEASKLIAAAIRISVVNSRGKEIIETSRVYKNRQLKTLKVQVQLAENKVAEKGIRSLYLQVLGPNKQPLFDVAKGSDTFWVFGEEQFYTQKLDFQFDTKEQILEFRYEKGGEYPPGRYEVLLFVGQYPVGRSFFTLQ